MAKKSAAPEFNLSALVREALTLDKTATSRTVLDYIEAKQPGAKINKGSFSVAFYTTRKKLGIVSGKTRVKSKVGIRTSQVAKKTTGGAVDMAALQAAAKLIRDVGSAEAAIEAIKSVQAVQIQ